MRERTMSQPVGICAVFETPDPIKRAYAPFFEYIDIASELIGSIMLASPVFVID
jgi:hypothetical protein